MNVFSGLAVRRGKPAEELKKMIETLGQSLVHSVVFHDEVSVLLQHAVSQIFVKL